MTTYFYGIALNGDLKNAFNLFNEEAHISGLGPSFFTKLFYFAGMACGMTPNLPLILDNKVEVNWNILLNSRFSQYRVQDYLFFVNTVSGWSKQINCRADAIEYFLFLEPKQFVLR
jgi:hypothetical protein